MLIKRVYEIDPLECPKCGGQMKVIAFIEPRAPERSDGRGDVIERILKHCGLWQAATPRAAARGRLRPRPRWRFGQPGGVCSDEPRELTYVDMDTFWATF